MSFDWNAFVSGEFAVNCRTEEAANRFMVECENRGLKWRDGKAATEHTFWHRYGSEVAYKFIVDGLAHADAPWFISWGKRVVEFVY